MVRVKVCGITREEDVTAAVEAGVDAVGFVCGFPHSPRDVSVERVGELIRTVPPFVDAVLVTRLELVANDPGMVLSTRPAALQLYGPRKAAAMMGRRFGVKLILPHLVGTDEDRMPGDGFDALLADSYQNGKFGGTGRVSDWEACRSLREQIAPKPFILSGGLNRGNVREAIRLVRPYAVDVSSGVEASPGVKDPSEVAAFVKAAKEAA